MREAIVEPIDAYVVALDTALRGPRRMRADMLRETRDSLIDASESYARAGMDRATAERRAVREFGDVDVIAPAYQTELSLAQGRRTGVVTLLALLVQPIVWNDAVLPASGPSTDPGPLYAHLSALVEWVGAGAIAGSVLAVLACGIGVRYLGTRPVLAWATGAFALTVSALLATLGIALTALHTAPLPMFDTLGVAWLVAFLLAPLGVVAGSAHRCLRMA